MNKEAINDLKQVFVMAEAYGYKVIFAPFLPHFCPFLLYFCPFSALARATSSHNYSHGK